MATPLFRRLLLTPRPVSERPRAGRRDPRCRHRRRQLRLESLEQRVVLAAATDLQEITGRVFADFTGNGFDPGEEIAGATINLYRDNGDGVFNPATDTLVRGVISGSDGRYTIDSITEGNYFVQQPAQTVAGQTLNQRVSPIVNVTATDVQGRLLTVIDSFNTAAQLVFDETNDGVAVTSSVQGPTSEIIGGERDLLVEKTSVNGRVQMSVNDPLLPGFLSFDSIQTGSGRRVVSWDGIDGDATQIDDTGLGGIDLTSGGEATGLQLQIGADRGDGTVTIRLYSDDGVAGTATRFSTAVVPIPDTGGTADSAEFVPFTAFEATSGGGANLMQIGAIEFEITGGTNVNGAANLIGAIGPTVDVIDFANFDSADLRLTKTASTPTPGVNEPVSFTITVFNEGPDAASGVVVTDLLPSQLTFTSSVPSQGNYVSSSGIWTVGEIAVGGSASLVINANVAMAGTITNTAEITAADQFDPNSTPGNNDPTEDDQASVTITSEAFADLSLTKTVSTATPGVGQDVNFTLTVRNGGPNAATGVTVQEQLPPGMTFVSATPTDAYNAVTGVWTIGSIAAGSTSTLTIVATPTIPGPLVNTAEVLTSDQQDPNSTPGNGVAGEDDQASVTINAQQIDLSLAQSVDNAAPNQGDTIVLTTLMANAGPSTATGIQVRAALPSGLTLVSTAPSVGTYNSANGIWTVPSLAAAANAQLRITAVVNTSNPVTVVAEVIAADQPDATSTPGNNDPNENDQASVTIRIPSADLSLIKTVDRATPNVGETVRYTVVVTNSGPDTATGVVVTDPLPAGMTFETSILTQGSYLPTTGRWDVGTIPFGATASLQVLARVDTQAPKTNTAQVTAADQADPNSTPGNNVPTEDDQDSVTITPQQVDVSLTKTVDIPRPIVGRNVIFTLRTENAGPNTATGIAIRDTLPDGLTFRAATPSAGSYDPGTGIWTVPSLAAGAAATLTVEATYDVARVLTNTAEVIALDQFDINSTPGNNDPGENDQDSVTLVPATADLSLIKTVDNAAPNLGQGVEFTLEVRNSGPDPATGVRVRDLLPSGLAFVSSVATSGSYNATTGIWDIGAIASGVTATLRISASTQATGDLENIAEVIAADQFDPDSTPGNNVPEEDDQDSVIVTPQLIDLSLEKSIDRAAPNVGENVMFTVTLRNAGPSTATGIQVRDRVPSEMTFVSAEVSSGSYNATSGIWTPTALASGATAILRLIARVDEPGAVVNTAEVMAADQPDIDSTPGNGVPGEDDIASVSFTTPVADLSLTKTVDNAAPNREEVITFTIVITNSGPDDATGIVVTDRLPSGFNFVSSSTTLGTFTSTAGTWVIAELPNGQSATLTIAARPTTIGPKTNIAEVTRADQSDPDSTPGNGDPTEDDFASVIVTPRVIDLAVRGEIDNLAPLVGDTVNVTYTVNNAGPQTATGVELLAFIPPGVTLIGNAPTQGDFDPVTGIWELGSLAAGRDASITLTFTVDTAGIKQTNLQVSAADQFDSDSTPGNNDPSEDDFASVVINAPRLLGKRLFLAR